MTPREQQLRREDARIAALRLTPKDIAECDAAVARGWSERAFWLALADRRESFAESARRLAAREATESVEAEESRWVGVFAGMAGDPRRQTVYQAEVGARGRRVAGWD